MSPLGSGLAASESPILFDDHYRLTEYEAAGQGLHQHQMVEFGMCHSGQGFFLIEERIEPFDAGTLIFIAPGTRHRAQSRKGSSSEWSWIYVDASALIGWMQHPLRPDDKAVWEWGSDALLVSGTESFLFANVTALVEELRLKKPWNLQLLRGVCLSIFARLRQMVPCTVNTGIYKNKASFDKITPAVDFMGTHFSENITIAQLAYQCCLSATAFSRNFSAVMGQSPYRYLNRIRIIAACNELTATDKPIQRIAADHGFSVLSSFDRQCRKITGKTPREIRKMR